MSKNNISIANIEEEEIVEIQEKIDNLPDGDYKAKGIFGKDEWKGIKRPRALGREFSKNIGNLEDIEPLTDASGKYVKKKW